MCSVCSVCTLVSLCTGALEGVLQRNAELPTETAVQFAGATKVAARRLRGLLAATRVRGCDGAPVDVPPWNRWPRC